ncbi:hypothetical protein STH12_02694 [Shewanella khirikhana]|jgi:hypothetical protein|uniref:Uncharacterized protein n=1 Tax=Shewanella khirikhana TaxID=1965282 RepID=A0ABM7DQ04_9GAMM|nr:hypothetical protein STH12_02694 [Shewanella khirikhana]
MQKCGRLRNHIQDALSKQVNTAGFSLPEGG